MVTRVIQVTNATPLQKVAIRARKVGNQSVSGGEPFPFIRIDQSDLINHGGDYELVGNANEFLIYEVFDGVPLAGTPIPIYIVNDITPLPPTDLTITLQIE